MDLLAGVTDYLYPVGRLDHDSEGLLLLTNDGDLAARLTHPRHGSVRVYEARVLGVPDARDLRRLAGGILVEGQRTLPAGVRALGAGQGRENRARAAVRITTVLEISVREGRNRQVRKMCDAIGHPVERLKRVALGPIRDDTLKPGRWRELSAREVATLKASTRDRTGESP
jgi:pseudouridine synthase